MNELIQIQSSPRSHGSSGRNSGRDFHQKVKKILPANTNENSQNSLFLTASPGFGRRFNSLSPYETTGLEALNSPSSGGAWDQTYGLDKANKWANQSAYVTNRGFKTGEYFSTKTRFNSVFQQSCGKFKASECAKELNPKYKEILAKLKDPSLIKEKQDKAAIKPDMTLLKRKLNDKSSKRIDEEIQKNKVINLGIPIISTHNLKEFQKNKIQKILNEPDKRPPERQWQQMQVMLPILKTTGATNMTRNEMLATKKLTEDAKAKLNQQIIHTPAELADFSIMQQFGTEPKTKRYSLQSSPKEQNQT